jgi:hypothetical protein
MSSLALSDLGGIGEELQLRDSIAVGFESVDEAVNVL